MSGDVVQINKKPQHVEDIIDFLVERDEKITDLYVVVFIDGHLILRGTGNWSRTCMAAVTLNSFAQSAVADET